MYYTGIGSRTCPKVVLDRFISWGMALAEEGFILRSGGANGADSAFELGCNKLNGKSEIYLPWQGFNNSNSDLHFIPIEVFEVAADVYGTGWKYLKPAVKKLMARNMMQVMGFGLEQPSEVIICWTPDGCRTAKQRSKETGGTGQAIAYADEMGIPIFNLYNINEENNLIAFFNNLCYATHINT